MAFWMEENVRTAEAGARWVMQESSDKRRSSKNGAR
jgi:hypothetical protein